MFVTANVPDVVRLYDSLAPHYDRLHGRWLRHAGGEAQAALEAVVRAVMHRGMTLLDVGCGTGRFARALINEGVPADGMTLLDPSEAMLRHCADLPVRRVCGKLERLPFDEGIFDIVTCAWALETTQHPELALSELCRVLRPGGTLCIVFCADVPCTGSTARLMRWAIERRATGRFLSCGMVNDALKAALDHEPRWLPCRGPVAACLTRRAEGRLPDAKTVPAL